MDDAAARERDTIAFGPLGDTLGFLLRLAQLDAFSGFFDAFEEDATVRPGEATVLILIGLNPAVRQGVLARQLRIKRAHMTKMVNAMEAGGLVTRTVPEDDRRAVELHLTPQGRARVDKIRGPILNHRIAAESRLSASERAELKRLLRKFLDLDRKKAAPS